MRPGSVFNMNHASPHDVAQSRRRDIESAVIMADGREEEIIDLTEENENEDLRFNPRADTPSEYSPPPSPSFENWTSHPQYTGNPPLSQQAGYHFQVSGHAHLTQGTAYTSGDVRPRMMEQNVPGLINAYRPIQSSGEQPRGPGSRVPVAQMLPSSPNPAHGILREADVEPSQPQRAPARRGRRARQPATTTVAPLQEETLVAAPTSYLAHPSTQGSARPPSGGSPAVGGSSTRPTARNRRGQANSGSDGPTQGPPEACNVTTLAADGPGGPSPAPASARRAGWKRRGVGNADPVEPELAAAPNAMPQGIVGVDEPSSAPARQPARKRRAGANAPPVGYQPATPLAAMTPTPEAAGGLAESSTVPPRRGRKRRAQADIETVAPAPMFVQAPVPAPAPAPASTTRTQAAPSGPPSENYFDGISDRDFAALNTPIVSPDFVPESEARNGAEGGSLTPRHYSLDEEVLPRPTSPIAVPSYILERFRMRPVAGNIPRRGGGLLIKQEMDQAKRRRRNGGQ